MSFCSSLKRSNAGLKFSPSRLPPTPKDLPSARRIEASKATTVLLPFEPVTATMGLFTTLENSAMSPITSTPACLNFAIASVFTLTPGLTIKRVAEFKKASRSSPNSVTISGNSALKTGSIAGAARVSATAKSAPIERRNRAQDNPVAPIPTISDNPSNPLLDNSSACVTPTSLPLSVASTLPGRTALT